MAVYGCHILTENNNAIEKEFTLEEVAQIQAEAMELMADLYFNEESEKQQDDEFDELMTEGANIEYTRAFRAGKKEYKQAIRSAKKAIKEKRYKDAKNHTKDAKKALDGIEKVLMDVDSSVGSAVIGFFIATLIDTIKITLPFIIGIGASYIVGSGYQNSFDNAVNNGDAVGAVKVLDKAFEAGRSIGYIANIISIVQFVVIMIKEVIQLQDDLNNNKVTSTQAYNYYRGKLCTKVKELRKNLDKIIDVIDKKEKSEK